MGFQVEKGIAGLPTAFRAVYEQGQGGPSFGLLAEYDALKDIGHACGHHMQGPSVIGAALALRDTCKDQLNWIPGYFLYKKKIYIKL